MCHYILPHFTCLIDETCSTNCCLVRTENSYLGQLGKAISEGNNVFVPSGHFWHGSNQPDARSFNITRRQFSDQKYLSSVSPFGTFVQNSISGWRQLLLDTSENIRLVNYNAVANY